MMAYEGILLVFGGYSGNHLNDIHEFDTGLFVRLFIRLMIPMSSRKTWRRIFATGEQPSPRYYHTAVVIDGVMLVFGGVGNNNTRDNTMWSLDLGM